MATDQSSCIEELEATVNTLTTQVERLDDQCEDLESRSRRNNIHVLGVPEVVEGPQAPDFITEVLQDLLRLSDKPLLKPVGMVEAFGSHLVLSVPAWHKKKRRKKSPPHTCLPVPCKLEFQETLSNPLNRHLW